MNNLTKFLFVALLASNLTSSNTAYGWLIDFDAFQEAIDQQMQSMKTMHKQFKTQFSTTQYPTISINTNEIAAIITVRNIEFDNLEAQLNDDNNQLSISIPIKKIVISTHHNIIGIEERDIFEQTKSNKDQKETCYLSSSISHTQTTVPGIPLLEKQSIDYDADKKELIITIPFKQTAKGKPVTINKKVKQDALMQAEPKTTEEAPVEK
jgi:hypothetical protein